MRFLRNTHVNGVFREELEDVKDSPPLVLHMLSPDEPLTFDKICVEHWKYERDHALDLTMAASIAYGLVVLLEVDMAKVVP